MDRNSSPIIRRWRRRGGLAVIAGLLVAVPVFALHAQSGGSKTMGTMDADAQGAFPKGTGIRVHTSSSAPVVQAIADMFRQALEDAGHPPSQDRSAYVLNFQIVGDSPSGNRAALELHGDRGSHDAGNVELKMRWKTRPEKFNAPPRGRRLVLSIVDADQMPVWRARVELHPTDADNVAVVDALMPALMANLGRTVYALRVP